jgi:hypothetical protein
MILDRRHPGSGGDNLFRSHEAANFFVMIDPHPLSSRVEAAFGGHSNFRRVPEDLPN